MRVFIETYGCTFNQADSDALANALKKAGHCETESEKNADLIVVNSCGVKNATEQRILLRLRNLRGKRVLVTGCLAQADPAKLLKANPEISLLGTFSQKEFVKAAEATLQGRQVKILSRKGFAEPVVRVENAKARIQVARGCLGECSFCQTKLARGTLESIPAKKVVRLCEQAVKAGAKEIQLTAQDTGCYGFDRRDSVLLPDLVKRVCAITGRFRTRIGMMNPQHAKKILSRLLEAYEDEKVFKFLHLPLQSGSDAVLREMKRHHSARDFLEAAAAFRKKFPLGTLATDVIIGFPGESEQDFCETLSVLRKAMPDCVNISRYSARPKTPAAGMKQLSNETINRRTRECSELCRAIARQRNQQRIGESGVVLVTEKQEKAWLSRDENYAPILLRKGREGEFVRARIIGSAERVLKGERI
ncbi:MAG: tRNA (N(6)-L-threonylcarbamoyladenosine(37)-C(2))-methylthiotransferase [Candidatus Micrarchaeia archaeon]|jgi:MiaB-like tRNA modifying enzyme